MQISSQHVIRTFLMIGLPLSLLMSFAAYFDAKHVHKLFLNQNFEQGSGIVLADETALRLYQNQIAPFDQKRIAQQRFLIGLFVQTEQKIEMLWCDDWQNTPIQTVITGKKNGLERTKLPVEYFHSCTWLFNQLHLSPYTWTGKSITYTKNQNDILYSLAIDNKTILDQQQAYQLYERIYASKNRLANHWFIFFIVCVCIALFHFKKKVCLKIKKP